ncbi:amidohydrolase [Clostridium cavendishii DSM 21758]|uniref:Peptidase M20 domain-containing protein 2 n=1 Tax=Clostridium cavendishii DSM 21758 TaxID=1121302 RepID=A0A1M6UZN8_9CLOT|nr:amidohydrolase [Clostridium cavendishii]SHK74712.1 amidohydrolase [Clostridium cavendishii DSM 21758]
MKQEIISYLSTEKEALFKLCKYLYDNPEESYKEFNACKYISSFLKERGFEVTNNFLTLETSFIAKKGSGYPKIGFLCEYDAIKDEGHVTGHNALTTIAITAAIGLGKVIEKTGGSINVIGCPGEYLGGTKSIMVRQGIFEDMDVVLVCHPDVTTCESGTSWAIVPLSVKFIGNNGLSFLNKEGYTSLDAVLLSFNIINSLLKGFPNNLEVNSILSKGGSTPLLLPTEAEAKFYIRSTNMDIARIAEQKIRETAYYVSNLMSIRHSVSLYEPPSEVLLSNSTLNRLFSHNLKENGIIDICSSRDIKAGLGLGAVSQVIPAIHPYIAITENANCYGTRDFAIATISEYGLNMAHKAGLSLSFTALDIIESKTLLSEIKNEFYEVKKQIY